RGQGRSARFLETVSLAPARMTVLEHAECDQGTKRGGRQLQRARQAGDPIEHPPGTRRVPLHQPHEMPNPIVLAGAVEDAQGATREVDKVRKREPMSLSPLP